MKNLILSTVAVAAFGLTATAQTTTDQPVETTTYPATDRAVQPNGNPDMDELPAVDQGTPDMDLPGMNTVETDAPLEAAETAPLEDGFTNTVDGTVAPEAENMTEESMDVEAGEAMEATDATMDTEEPEDGLSDDLPFLDDSNETNDEEMFGDKEDADFDGDVDPVERTIDAVSGESDDAMDTMDDAGDNIEEGAESAWDATEDTMDNAGENIEEGAENAWDATEDTMDNAGENIEEGVENAMDETGEALDAAGDVIEEGAEEVEEEVVDPNPNN